MRKIKFLKNEKFLGYAQFLVTTVICAVVLTVIFCLATGCKERYTIHAALSVAKVAFTSVVGIISLREIKYLKTKRYFGDSAYMSLVIIIPLLTLFYRYFFDIDGVIDMPYKLYEWTLYIVMATCLVYGIVHLRFGIAAALIVAGTYPITGYTEAKYFGILGVFLLIALIGFIIRKVFFTKWTSYVKEEPVVETEEDTEK